MTSRAAARRKKKAAQAIKAAQVGLTPKIPLKAVSGAHSGPTGAV